MSKLHLISTSPSVASHTDVTITLAAPCSYLCHASYPAWVAFHSTGYLPCMGAFQPYWLPCMGASQLCRLYHKSVLSFLVRTGGFSPPALATPHGCLPISQATPHGYLATPTDHTAWVPYSLTGHPTWVSSTVLVTPLGYCPIALDAPHECRTISHNMPHMSPILQT